MPCNSGCCGSSPVAASGPIEIPNAQVVGSSVNQDQTLPGKDLDPPGSDELATNDSPGSDDAHCSSKPAGDEAHAPIAQQGCCSSREMGVADGNDCCLPNPSEKGSDICCSSRPEPASVDGLDETQAPSCCEGVAAPCCDQSCLDRLALRACLGADHASIDSAGK